MHQQTIAGVGQRHADAKAKGHGDDGKQATQLVTLGRHQTGLCQRVKRNGKTKANAHGMCKRTHGLQNFALHRAACMVVIVVARIAKLQIAVSQPQQEEC